MMDKILLFLTRKLKRKYIGWDGQLYLTRYYLGKVGKWEFHLHRFTRGDNDRRVHDHPYEQSYSFILSGGYDEERLIGVCPYNGPITTTKVRKWFNPIDGLDFHRITRLHKPIVWTLFVHTPKFKEWGFLEYGTIKKLGVDSSHWFHDPFVQDDERHYWPSSGGAVGVTPYGVGVRIGGGLHMVTHTECVEYTPYHHNHEHDVWLAKHAKAQ